MSPKPNDFYREKAKVTNLHLVVRPGRKEVAVEVGVPREAVALLLVTAKPEIRLALSVGVGLAGMLGVVENEHVARGRLSGNDAGVLRKQKQAWSIESSHSL